MSPAPNFDDKLFRFLRQLKKNNRRDWFQDHKEQYEDSVKHPSLQFISDFGPRLRKSVRNSLRILAQSAVRCFVSTEMSGSRKTRVPIRPRSGSSFGTSRPRTSILPVSTFISSPATVS